ncbi:hypothetical protein BKA58DRAFT_394281 [Alternaria rosae]|uniref:uncharacterized protein n=1 Tax=Alternaria rosae TaxID=1187941 RepID=UPI001E8D38ED|nr:uncharacterized protein BKA58DRAFT_394266 [Alternaria rosae]XP_046020134.1 uncharacterized protein BKA58DRAFT_394281 [Alternaria rosae]KAH6852814.1 hypothetical protein BKA58DRAFT_394266 [Alternaria rosae]KAH6852819.1 hypothetical protein BKA58DRAFT_394281 [Alternaria rosae]
MLMAQFSRLGTCAPVRSQFGFQGLTGRWTRRKATACIPMKHMRSHICLNIWLLGCRYQPKHRPMLVSLPIIVSTYLGQVTVFQSPPSSCIKHSLLPPLISPLTNTKQQRTQQWQRRLLLVLRSCKASHFSANINVYTAMSSSFAFGLLMIAPISKTAASAMLMAATTCATSVSLYTFDLSSSSLGECLVKSQWFLSERDR